MPGCGVFRHLNTGIRIDVQYIHTLGSTFRRPRTAKRSFAESVTDGSMSCLGPVPSLIFSGVCADGLIRSISDSLDSSLSRQEKTDSSSMHSVRVPSGRPTRSTLLVPTEPQYQLNDKVTFAGSSGPNSKIGVWNRICGTPQEHIPHLPLTHSSHCA